ncbi:Uncharacterized protein GBIM_17005 [Gryllus bimaculatus]|nr:Uncharacterized protein GBIM_17005 [Gryllus bimaculatus]
MVSEEDSQNPQIDTGCFVKCELLAQVFYGTFIMVIQKLSEGFGNMNEKYGNLNVVKIAGGSIVEHPAIFSSNGKNLFVVHGNCIRSYNVETGELVTVYNGLSKDAAGVALHPTHPDKLVAVSCVGEFIEWECSSRGSCVRKSQLGEITGKFVVQSFSLVQQQDEETPCVVCVAAVSGQNQACVKTFCSVSGKERNLFGKIRVDNHNRSLAVRQTDGEILLAGYCNKPKTTLTFCVSYNGSETKETQVFSQNKMTCVACHPTELCVITGDIIGCVRVWKNLLRKPVYSSYHWHTLPVQSVVFSDSGIQLVNSSLQCINSIQCFCWSSLPSDGKYLLPVEMTTDPRTKALVTNGRVGHLQFFSVDQRNLLFLLDVVGRNYLTQERSKKIQNTDVVKFAFNSDGSWLASVEFCEGEEKVPQELRLKFWEYNKVSQKYVLNTCVENPHRGAVKAIQFRPSANNENLMCVTAGEDFKFRTWSLQESTSIYRKGLVWNSENVGFYRNIPIGDLSFSSDGSLMAIAFGPTLTVWVPGSNQLKCSLTRPDAEEHLSHVEFGRRSCVHLVVTGSKLGIAVWNLLSVSLLWVVHFNLSVLVSDPISEVVAAFSDENDFVIFSPNCPDPIFKQNGLISCEDSQIVNGVFVPHARQRNSNISWQSTSQLHFFNSKQELFTLEHSTSNVDTEENRNLDVLPTESLKPKTPYAALLAQQSQSDVIDTKIEQHKHLGIPGFETLQELLKSPAHSMPPLSLVSHSLLLSFITGTNKRRDDPNSHRELSDEDDEEMDYNDDSDKEEKEDQTSERRLENIKRELMSKHESTVTTSMAADTEQHLLKIQKKPLDWVSELLT